MLLKRVCVQIVFCVVDCVSMFIVLVMCCEAIISSAVRWQFVVVVLHGLRPLHNSVWKILKVLANPSLCCSFL